MAGYTLQTDNGLIFNFNEFPLLALNKKIIYITDDSYVIDLLKTSQTSFSATVHHKFPQLPPNYETFYVIKRLLDNRFELGMYYDYVFTIFTDSTNPQIDSAISWTVHRLQAIFPTDNISKSGLSIIVTPD
jgi:hypothetical protein